MKTLFQYTLASAAVLLFTQLPLSASTGAADEAALDAAISNAASESAY